MGSATAWHLARRGVDVHLVERFEPGHTRGASHGARRNFNVAYDRPHHLAWLREAREGWAELEAEAGATLLSRSAMITHGHDDLDPLAAAIRAGGFAAEVLDAAAAAARWPGFRFDGPVLHNPDAGQVHADEALRALQSGAERHGARISWNTRVVEIAPAVSGARVTIEDAAGRRILNPRRVVLTAGAWSAGLAAGLVPLPRLRVTQEQPAHFAVRDESLPWPGFNHFPSAERPVPVYGMLTPGEGLKAGWHAAGPEIDPDRRTFRPDPALTAGIRTYAREWLPGVDPDSLTEITCTYTSTPDAEFVLERRGPVVVGAGFSGHGFKFTPTIGRILADLATASSSRPSSGARRDARAGSEVEAEGE